MKKENVIRRKLVVCETEGEISHFEIRKLVKSLNEKFGSRGLEFKVVKPSIEPKGVAAVISKQYAGFAVLNLTLDAINHYVRQWVDERDHGNIRTDDRLG